MGGMLGGSRRPRGSMDISHDSHLRSGWFAGLLSGSLAVGVDSRRRMLFTEGMDDVVSLTLDEIRATAELLSPVIQTTPVEFSESLSRIADMPVWLKCENLQSGGSFKIRGDYMRMSRLSPEDLRV